MLEAIVSASIAVLAAGAAFSNKIHTRINNVHSRVDNVDQRIDTLELKVATQYVPKQEFAAVVARLESHMTRIEDKLDQMLIKNG